jgi:hypothetical protein
MNVRGRCIRYYYDNQIKENEMSPSCSTHLGDENAYTIVVGNSEGKN